MTYQTTTSQTRETAKLRPASEQAKSTAMPFVFGLRRRAMNTKKEQRTTREDLDHAVGSYSTD